MDIATDKSSVCRAIDGDSKVGCVARPVQLAIFHDESAILCGQITDKYAVVAAATDTAAPDRDVVCHDLQLASDDIETFDHGTSLRHIQRATRTAADVPAWAGHIGRDWYQCHASRLPASLGSVGK